MISLLLINFRSSSFAVEAIRTARATCSAPLQVVVVDNSCDPAEAEALRPFAGTLIVSPANLGYAGGINAGRRACEGDTIVIANPDVLFAPGCLDALAAALSAKVAVAGPALFWDSEHRWRLPPGDLWRAPEKLDQVLASRSPAWREQWHRRRLRKRLAFWSLRQPASVTMLSGAVMAVRARAFDEIGGFDERFALYFEETDFLRRIAARRLGIVYVPDARCRHLYNQSAGQNATLAGARYAESELKYLEKWNGPFLARLMKRLERTVTEPNLPYRDLAAAPLRVEEGMVVEASPLVSFDTAAGLTAPEPDEAVTVPPEVLESLRDGPLYLRVVTRQSGVVRAAYKIAP